MITTLLQANSSRRTALALAATLLTALTLQGCRKDMAAVQQAPIVDGNDASDPANANMATPLVGASLQPAYATTSAPGYAAPGYAAPATRVAGSGYNAPQSQSAQNYPPANGARNEAYDYNTQPPQGYAQQQSSNPVDDDQLYSDLLDPNAPIAQQPPPPLPVYEQPVAPGPDYLWTPGYWNYAPANYSNAGYYYVPGNWISAPFVGALWTPGWWGYTGRGYGWHRGYWGRHVGYYGGVNYGFGFIGIGYQGGYWNNDHFFYNRDCNHVEPRVVNNYVYQRNVTVINNTYINNSRTSYYGGPGGLQRRPVQAEFAAQREVHIAPLAAQIAERQQASQNRQQYFAANSGRPAQLFAAHPVLERNVAVPPQLARPQFNNGNNARDQAGFHDNQLRQQQQAAMQQQVVQRGQVNLQRQQQDVQRQQQQQQFQAAHSTQQQQFQGRQLQNQQRTAQQDHAHLQQDQRAGQQNQAHLQDQQRAAQQNQAHLQDQQRAAQQNQAHLQDQQLAAQQNQARLQQNQSRVAQQNQFQHQRALQSQQQDQQRVAQQQQRTVQAQQNRQRAQQQDQQRAFQQQQRPQVAQQQVARPQPEQQREPQQRQAQAQQPRPQPAPQPQVHVEAPHAAPAPHAEAGRPRR